MKVPLTTPCIGSWRLVDKIGTTLDSIHTRGGVAGWKEKLNRSTEKFFLNLKVDKPVQRNNVCSFFLLPHIGR